MTGAPQPAPPEIYAAFAGAVDQAAVQRIFHNFGIAMNTGIRHVHLLFQSSGGTVAVAVAVADGVCLYNFFRALPIDGTLYNVGSIASAAVIAYLGAQNRKTSTYATFMVHRTQAPTQSATAERLHAMAHSVVIDDERLEAIQAAHQADGRSMGSS
jgi:ATP-dependent protease ClpP protease subunit